MNAKWESCERVGTFVSSGNFLGAAEEIHNKPQSRRRPIIYPGNSVTHRSR